mmetsp:Transcript_34504/g.103341  ORF Transcript_34504/g.103341 Transcript_34504/m.103341 type:complete len:168 (-) Transcript_34504:117-620(-)
MDARGRRTRRALWPAEEESQDAARRLSRAPLPASRDGRRGGRSGAASKERGAAWAQPTPPARGVATAALSGGPSAEAVSPKAAARQASGSLRPSAEGLPRSTQPRVHLGREPAAGGSRTQPGWGAAAAHCGRHAKSDAVYRRLTARWLRLADAQVWSEREAPCIGLY